MAIDGLKSKDSVADWCSGGTDGKKWNAGSDAKSCTQLHGHALPTLRRHDPTEYAAEIQGIKKLLDWYRTTSSFLAAGIDDSIISIRPWNLEMCAGGPCRSSQC